MTRIVYGVSGEGSGHSSRAREMIRYLERRGHEVKVASYERGFRNLKDDFDVQEIVGLKIVSEGNQVSKLKTLTSNLANVPSGLRALKNLKQALFKTFKPECVISDFEPMTAYLANHYDIPLVSLDNQHRLRYMSYPCPDKYQNQSRLTRAIIKTMVPKPCVSLITTFYFGELNNSRSFLFPPILRQEVLDKSPDSGQHVLVYITSEHDTLLDVLKEINHERFVVYGYNKQNSDGQLLYKPFSRAGFLNDLANAKAVIATAGFTLMTESFYLRKPYLALPMQGQFEQVLNGLMLNELGYGMAVDEPSKATISSFLDQTKEYSTALKHYDNEGNQKITDMLDKLLENNASLLMHYFELRN